jgi:elongation factor 1-beta
MASLPEYDISVDELRVALSWVNPDLVLKTIQIDRKKPAAAAAPIATKAANAKAAAAEPAKKKAADEDDFDVFGDDDEEEEDPKESRAEMLARLKKEAEERAAVKEAKQRTLVAIEVKPWDVEQDLMALWKKIVETITQPGLKWGESCTLADVAYGIKKVSCLRRAAAVKCLVSLTTVALNSQTLRL